MDNNIEDGFVVENTKKNFLFFATPLSKYLAMTLFIILPFIGGYIGYNLAPEKEVGSQMFLDNGIKNLERDSLSEDSAIGVNKGESTDWNNMVEDNKIIEFPIIWEIEQYGEVSINNEIFSSSSNPGSLSYDKNSFYINGQKVYDIDSGTFEIYDMGIKSKFHFMRLGKNIYGMVPTGLSTVSLIEFKDIEMGSFKTLGYGYASDGTHLYYVTNPVPLSVDLPFAKPEFIHLDEVGVILLVIGDKVFHEGTYLEGLSFTNLVIGSDGGKPKGYYLKDGDVTYVQGVNCHSGSYYKLGNESDIKNWRPGC